MATPIPENRARFSLDELALATGAELRAGKSDHVIGVTTDSRGELGGRLFVALSGERFDGHDFVDQARKGGAAAVLVEREVGVDASLAVLRVPSTLSALGALARTHRRRWGKTLVAVAGSAGKTTTKSAIACALEAVLPKGSLHFARGNLNNRVGVPMVLLGLRAEHQAAVLEIGTNRPGEVAALSRVSEPDVGVLTLIDFEHSEGLGDLDAIEREEGALFQALLEGGVAIGCGDDPRVMRRLERSAAYQRITYGARAHADYRLIGRRQRSLTRTELEFERPTKRGRARGLVETRLFGHAGALAVLAATAVVDQVAGAAVEETLLSSAFVRDDVQEPGRLSPIELEDGSVVIDDSYNSNPASVLSSLSEASELAAARSARLVLVLGEMLELGEHAEAEHDRVAEALSTQAAAACLIAVGRLAARFERGAERAGMPHAYAETAERALELVLERMKPRDVVLVKASRGVHADGIVEGLIAKKGRVA